MSYARFGWDGSDVYVYTSSEGLECYACALVDVRWVEDHSKFAGGYMKEVHPGSDWMNTAHSNAEMIEHLEVHRAAGHTVPDDVFERLRDPADAADNERIWAEKR